MSVSTNRPSCTSGPGRSTVISIFAFSCGVILLYWLSILPPPEWLLGLVFVLIFTAGARYSPATSRFLAPALALLVGLSWASWCARERLDQVLAAGQEGRTLSVSGYLCDIPSPGSFSSLRFSLCVTQWHGPSVGAELGAHRPRLLRLAWYGHDGQPLPGHRLRLEVVLKSPHGTLNPAGFRYEDWLFRKGYRATGSVRSAEGDPAVPCSLQCRYRSLHLLLNEWTVQRFGESAHFPLVSSLLIGHRGPMEQRHWDVLKATGTIHLVAISGLHLGLIALGAGFVCRRLLLALPASAVSENTARRVVFFVVLACCLLYALAAGFTVPTRRALIMVVVGGWVVLMGRQSQVWPSFFIALALVLLLDPFAPLDQGFWLSFAAVAVLIGVFSSRLAGSGWLAGLVLAQIAVFAGLWPVLEAFGQGQPLAGLLANLVAIPWVSLVVMPLLVAGALVTALIPEAATLFVPLFDLVLGVLWGFLEWLAGWQTPDIVASAPELAGWAALMLVLVFAPFTAFRWTAGLLAILWLLYPRPIASGNPQMVEPELRIWDVGQGLSVMIRHVDKVMVYDTGPAVPGVFSAVESTLLPNLKAEGIQRIDTLVISHADNDHVGGLSRLVDQIETGQIIAGEVAPTAAKLPHRSVLRCLASSRQLGALEIDYWQGDADKEGNDASCVLRIYHADSGIEWLLPGDITERVEAQYLAYLAGCKHCRVPRTRVIIAPHHGSQTSSSPAWVSGLKPDWVIYTAGYRHRYGHPHPTVTARYRQTGAAALNTACSGSILMKVRDNRLVIKEMRDDAPFWIGGPGLARDQCTIP